MTIERFPCEGLGRCEAVVSDGLVYAVATDPQLEEDILAQTRNTLEELARILKASGSGKAGLLRATIYLSDVRQKSEMDKVWIDWIGPEITGHNVPASALSLIKAVSSKWLSPPRHSSVKTLDRW